MSNSETIKSLEQKQARIYRRFWFEHRSQMVVEFAPAIAAVAMIAAKIRILRSQA